ncbi:hypothetical protein [Flavobacterium litorale]|uniref:Uncharacterized protein n=1 Tax=Flavobacterium litorale TaxID=2856519 RepID=A0ABX8V795_9FLAO|nr:hypothetical protein [Flavobacterium litorale]QYJ68714.1 hypothetical protein K1I41_02205 [Flavobacterium litorale]
MKKEAKPIYTGTIAQDEDGNYFCGDYLLDYRKVATSFTIGDKIAIKSVIDNPSDKSYNQYPKKSKDFELANKNKWVKTDTDTPTPDEN